MTFENLVNGLVVFRTPIRDFTVEDANGLVPMDEVMIGGKNTIKIKLSRDIVGKGVVHGGFGPDPEISIHRCPDIMPILGFYGNEICINQPLQV
jgi:hypothetical protein